MGRWIALALLVLDLAAWRWGVDSRDGRDWRSEQQRAGRSGERVSAPRRAVPRGHRGAVTQGLVPGRAAFVVAGGFVAAKVRC
jgi:hypothetical protein